MAIEEKRLNLNLKFTATDSSDGSSVFDTEVSWIAVSYGGFVMIEKELIESLKRMNDFGSEKASKSGDWEEGKKDKR